MYLVLTIRVLHVVAAPARGGLSVQTMVLRIQNQVPLPPSPDPIRWPIPSHPIPSTAPPSRHVARRRPRAGVVVLSIRRVGRYTQHVPKFLATNRRHDAMTRVDLDDSASGPLPAGLGHGHMVG